MSSEKLHMERWLVALLLALTVTVAGCGDFERGDPTTTVADGGSSSGGDDSASSGGGSSSGGDDSSSSGGSSSGGDDSGSSSGGDDSSSSSSSSGSSSGGSEPTISFADEVLPALNTSCGFCHNASHVSALKLSGDAAASYSAVSGLVTAGDPEGSALLQKARGLNSHGGGAVWTISNRSYVLVADWITEGAIGP